MKILITEPDCYVQGDLKLLEDRGYNLYFFENGLSQQEFDNYNKSLKPEVIFTKIGVFLSIGHLNSNSNLRLVATPTTGLNHIDTEVLKRITVLSLKDDKEFLNNITSTAEHAWFLLLNAVRNSENLFIAENTQSWSRYEKKNINQIAKKNLGIVGLGRLGKIIAGYANAFRMNVYYHDIKKDPYYLDREKIQKLNLAELFECCHYIVLAASYNGYYLIDKKLLSKIKSPVDVLVNIARGELVDESALVSAVESGIIKNYSTDVLQGDSSWTNSEFISNILYQKFTGDKKAFITPHVGGYAREAISQSRHRIVTKFLMEMDK